MENMLHAHLYARDGHWRVGWLINNPMKDAGLAGGTFDFGSSLDWRSDSPVELLERLAHALDHCAKSYRSVRGSSWPCEGELPIWAGYGRGHSFHAQDTLVSLGVAEHDDTPW